MHACIYRNKIEGSHQSHTLRDPSGTHAYDPHNNTILIFYSVPYYIAYDASTTRVHTVLRVLRVLLIIHVSLS